MESELPPCQQREQTETEGVFFCRHPQVRVANGLVSAAICRLCSMREVPVQAPRTRESVAVVASPRLGNYPVGSPPILQRPPSLPQQSWNLARSLASFAADGFKTVTKEEYEQRLAICDTCDRRSGTRCLQCGCGLALKAKGRAFQCPLKKWPQLQNSNDQGHLTVER